jgi:hypothetical protein
LGEARACGSVDGHLEPATDAKQGLLTSEWRVGRVVGPRVEQTFSVSCDRSTMNEAEVVPGPGGPPPAQLLGWNGERGRVSYVMPRAGAEPIGVRSGALLDYEHYLERQLLPIARSDADAPDLLGPLQCRTT